MEWAFRRYLKENCYLWWAKWVRIDWNYNKYHQLTHHISIRRGGGLKNQEVNKILWEKDDEHSHGVLGEITKELY
jgi:hypothetical protein